MIPADHPALAQLTADPGRVPCSQWGRDSHDCAPVAIILAETVADASGYDPTPEDYDWAMGLVVNDHDDVAYTLTEHAHEILARYDMTLEDLTR